MMKLVTSNAMSSVPKKSCSAPTCPPSKQMWPEGCSGYGAFRSGVRGGQVHHREQPGAVREVNVVVLDQVTRDYAPEGPAGTGPKERGAGLVGRADRARDHAVAAESLDLVVVGRVHRARERVRAGRAELRRVLDQEGLHATHPRRRIECDRSVGEHWGQCPAGIWLRSPFGAPLHCEGP